MKEVKVAEVYLNGKHIGRATNIEFTIREDVAHVQDSKGTKLLTYPVRVEREIMIDMEEKIEYNKKEEREETNMKTLFNIIAVYNEEVVFEKKQVGTDANNAVFKSGLYGKLNEMGVEDLDDVSILTTSIGRVKAGKANAPKVKKGNGDGCSHDCSSCGGCK